ncbi:anti-sigma factor [Jidongwangia harbinensis]|uniref:anti-sigma factor n=1 Tax=Jidongwangia harbinensis TaxID=2878561 RepID=UPI001CD920E2|nr:anti-sigma factor [Jidongwangia harbinensis]MCA2213485.1 anti-sigma factor [Jidongwangia harbinensis]
MTDDIHALVGAYALNAVDDLERAAFERHLADCPACRADADELRETAARLAGDTWSVPPPRLRGEVLAAIGRTRQLPPVTTAAARPEQSGWRRRLVAAAAAVALAGGTGAAVYAVQEQRVRENGTLAAEAQLREARTRSILAAPDVVVRTAPMSGGGKVTVASSALRDAGVVLVGADQAPAADQAFQLWTVRGGGAPVAVPDGVLAAGSAVGVEIVDGLPDVDAVAVSLEPAGGSVTPTTVVGQVSPI